MLYKTYTGRRPEYADNDGTRGMSDGQNDEIAGKEDGLYPIRTVASLTGVNPVTLRAWERRYGLIKPRRTESGRRLYTQQDVDLIHRVLALLDEGVPIGQVKAVVAGQVHRDAETIGDRWAAARAQMVTAIARFDEDTLNELYNDALAQYPIDIVTRRLIVPLLDELGRRWQDSKGTVAEEHFFSVFLRNKLGARFHHQSAGAAGTRLFAACIPGEQHQIGLLLFGLAAQNHGFKPILLGADMPLAELPAAARRTRAAAIVLSSTIDDALQAQLKPLALLTEECRLPVFVGGPCAVTRHDEIKRAGAYPLGADISQGLRLIEQRLSGQSDNRH